MENADLIIYNAHIYTVNEQFETISAMAIKGDKIIATGSDKEILKKFNSEKELDMNGQFIYPGFIDAHCHFYGYGLFRQKANLTEAKSFDEVIEILIEFDKQINPDWIVGRGWDQNKWEDKNFPTNQKLNELFPDKPVILYRVDGHAVLVNEKAFQLADIDEKKYKDFITYENNVFTGILIDNAADIAKSAIPDPSERESEQALLLAQKDCFGVGLTTVSDAGLDQNIIQIIDALNKANTLKMRMYAMLNPNQANMDFIAKNGIYKTDYLNIRSIKLYADGALGSRGACLLNAYKDDDGNFGYILETQDYFDKYCKIAKENGFQICTHAIGDSANRFVAKSYLKYLDKNNDLRWRIEHTQIVDPDDYQYFQDYNIIPSVQPTHATSDMYWAEKRLGDRIKYAYAYKTLMNTNGWIPHGSDFPVESINPLFGFYAAVSRQDHKGYPENGFQKEEALSREEALKAMTIWAAKSNFEENEKGSLEKGKFADFVVLKEDLMKCDLSLIPKIEVVETYSGGEKVYSK